MSSACLSAVALAEEEHLHGKQGASPHPNISPQSRPPKLLRRRKPTGNALVHTPTQTSSPEGAT